MSNIALIAGNLVSDSGASLSSKADLVDGKVPSTQLPSYVDDVLEYANLAGFPVTGEAGKIYVAQDSNKIYRWSGTTYIEVSPTVGTVWGGITGTLLNQTDLQAALDAKVAGTGTVNYISKFTSTSGLGNSQIFDNGTNVGIGVVPLATTLGKSLSIGSAGNGLLSYDVGNTYLTQNTYYNEAWKYANSAAASQFILFGGEHLFYTAPSGTAGTNVTLTERMRITSAGNVGIGDTSPSDLLVVNGRMRVNGANPIAFGNSAGGYAQIGVTAATTGNLAFSTYDGASLGERMRITAAGNVGIGTTSPAEKLQVVGNIRIQNETGLITDFGTLVGRYNTDQVYVGVGSYSIVKIARADGGGLNALPGGNVGIGTSSPNVKLEVAGLGRFTGTNGFSIGADAGQNRIQYSTSTFSRFALLSSGDAYAGLTAKELSIGATYGGTAPPSSGAIIEGNVGIANPNPVNRLHVYSPNRTSLTATGGGINLNYNGSTTGEFSTIGFSWASSVNDHTRWGMGLTGTNFSSGLADLFFFNGGVERMRVNAFGHVGIGVTPSSWSGVSPSLQLGVSPFIASTGQYLYLASNIYYDGTNGIYTSNGSATTYAQSEGNHMFNTAGSGTTGGIATFTERMRITSGGNVGIGTTNPGARLHVVSSTNAIFATLTNGGILLREFGSDLANNTVELHVRPNAGKSGYLTFTEDAVADKWAIGVQNGNTALRFLSGGPAGTERMRIFANGRVAINTTTDAGYQLDVNGGTRVTGRLTITGNDTLAQTMSRAGTSAFSAEIYNSGGDNSWLIWGVESSVGGVIFPGSTAYAAVIGQFRNTPLEFFTNNTIRGSFSGAGAFRVHNLAGTGSRIVVADANGVLSTTDTAPVTGTGTTNYIPKFTAASTIGNSIIQDNGTDVGIGSNSAGARLEILRTATGAANNNTTGSVFGSLHGSGGGPSAYGFAIRHNASAYAGISGSNFVSQLVSSSTNSNALEMYTTGATPLVFGTSATERLRITSGGNVGIGTATAVGKLTINSALGDHIQLQRSGQTDRAIVISSSDQLVFGTWASPTQMVLASNGRLLLNTTTDAGYQLDVNGAGRFAGALRAQGTIHATNNNDNNSGDFLGLLIGSSTGGTARTASIIKNTSSPYDLTIRSQDNTSTTTGSLIFVNGSTEQMRINSSGNVGIGRVSANTRLDIDAPKNTTGIRLSPISAGDAGDYTQIGISNTSLNADYAAVRFAYENGLNNWYNTAISFHTFARFPGNSLVERMRIDGAGNVGIGTTSPTSKLDVLDGDISVNTFGTFSFFNTNRNTILSGAGTSLGGLRYRAYSTGTTYQVGAQILSFSSAAWSSTSSPSYLSFQTTPSGSVTPSERMVIDASGNVGIGVVPVGQSGFKTLEIGGTGVSGLIDVYQGTTRQLRIYNSGSDTYLANVASGGGMLFRTTTSGGTQNNNVAIFTTGRVGVNTTTDAGYQLDVNGSIRAIGLIRSQATVGNTNGYFQLEHPGSQTWKLGVFADNASTFSIGNDNGGVFASRYLNITNVGDIGIATTSPSYKLDINGTLRSVNGANFATTSGNVGIGTASPSSKLQVKGAINIERSSTTDFSVIDNEGNFNIKAATGGTGGNFNIVFQTAGAEAGRINTAGKWVLNNTFSDAGDYKLQVSGNIYNTGSAVLAAAGGEVLIGTTTDLGAYKLQVNGISFFGSNANKYVLLNNTSSNAAIQAYGDWVNHLRLTYPAVVDFDMQVTAAGELDVKRSSNVVTRINAAGKFLINTTTDVGDYKLQVNGSVYNTGQVTAGVINIQGTGAQLFVDGTTNLSPLSAIQTLSGANNSAFLSGNVTWNTTGSPNAIDISVTNTASGSNANFMQLGDGTNNFKVTKDAGIITANPTSGTARKWKLGSVVSSTVVLVTSQYVEVEINGTFYRLALVTPA